MHWRGEKWGSIFGESDRDRVRGGAAAEAVVAGCFASAMKSRRCFGNLQQIQISINAILVNAVHVHDYKKFGSQSII